MLQTDMNYKKMELHVTYFFFKFHRQNKMYKKIPQTDTCYMLHVTFYMLYVTHYMLLVTCYILYVTCCMLNVACCMFHVFENSTDRIKCTKKIRQTDTY